MLHIRSGCQSRATSFRMNPGRRRAVDERLTRRRRPRRRPKSTRSPQTGFRRISRNPIPSADRRNRRAPVVRCGRGRIRARPNARGRSRNRGRPPEGRRTPACGGCVPRHHSADAEAEPVVTARIFHEQRYRRPRHPRCAGVSVVDQNLRVAVSIQIRERHPLRYRKTALSVQERRAVLRNHQFEGADDLDLVTHGKAARALVEEQAHELRVVRGRDLSITGHRTIRRHVPAEPWSAAVGGGRGEERGDDERVNMRPCGSPTRGAISCRSCLSAATRYSCGRGLCLWTVSVGPRLDKVRDAAAPSFQRARHLEHRGVGPYGTPRGASPGKTPRRSGRRSPPPVARFPTPRRREWSPAPWSTRCRA